MPASKTKLSYQLASGESAKVQQGVDWRGLAERLPTGQAAIDVTARRRLFEQFDVNGKNFLSLDEVDHAVRDVIRCPESFYSLPAVQRAYQATRAGQPERPGGEFVERSEFRVLLQCLR